MKHLFFLLLFTNLMLNAQHHEQKYSLFYANDAYEITPHHQIIIDSIRSIEAKDSVDVHIKGYTNSVGATQYNLELSHKRADQVKNQLRAFTIISSTGYGELNSAASANRRVDILVHDKRFHVPEIGEVVIQPIKTKEIEAPAADLILDPKVGDKITLQGIMFYTDRDVIMDESKSALEELVSYLKRNPKLKFKLIGHICCGDPMKPYKDLKNVRTGKDNLSEARAQALQNYLVKQGINKRRMRYFGMAFRQPTGQGDQLDRRVEIEITSID